jgi:Glycosyltransferases involved in cell wall biogenesis
MKNSMVTIASTTYNMEAFIAEALDSWLAQKTSFPFDILISDDGSTDGTCDVVRRYMEKYPNIRLISTGHIGKMPNFIRSLKESKGKYIALCDGDDYWIDPEKLTETGRLHGGASGFPECFT